MCSDNQLIIEQKTDEQQRRIAMHDQYRDALLQRQLSNNENYDRTIIALSSTGLALSLTAVNWVVPFTGAANLWLIQSAWLLFLVTIVCALVAYIISNKAIDKQLDIAEAYYIQGDEDAFADETVYSKLNNVINVVTGIAFIAAISLVIFYVVVNTDGVKNMTEKKNMTQYATDSASVPKMQKVASPSGLETRSAQIPKMQAVPSNVPSKPSSGSSEKPSE